MPIFSSKCLLLLGLVFSASLVSPLLAQSKSQPQPGGILRVAQRAEPKTLNPAIALDAPSREILRRMHADLITINRATLQTVPGLASAWKVSRDGRTYTLQLRPNVRFSDGHPFTADDVAFTFAVLQDEAVAAPQRDLLVFEGRPIVCKVLSSTTVQFELPVPYAAAERLFDSIAILPRHQLEAAWKAGKFRQAWTLATPPEEMAVLGPFRLKKYTPGESVLLERNPFYWDKPKPFLDGISFRLLPDEETQLAYFVSGQLDQLNRLPPKAVQYMQSKNKPVTDLGPSLEYNFVCFNLSPTTAGKRYESAAFRRALSAAVDRQALANIVFQGRAVPIWGPVSPANKQWYMPPAAKPNHAVAEAKRMLHAAGFHPDAQPISFTLLVSASSSERLQMANLIAADWKELGIDVQVVALEFRALLDRVLKTKQYDAVLLGLGGADADPNPEMNVWLSSGGMHLWNPEQKSPATPWEAEIDRLIRAQMVALHVPTRRLLYHSALRLLEREMPMLFLITPHIVAAQSGAVGNFQPAPMDHYTLWNSAELYFKRP